jgi:mannose-6-phosphate isomerase
VDGNIREEWIASKVKTLNKEIRDPDEGLLDIQGEGTTFASLLANNPEEITRSNGFEILVKILDSAVRLPVHIHPDPNLSRQHFASTGAVIMMDGGYIAQ